MRSQVHQWLGGLRLASQQGGAVVSSTAPETTGRPSETYALGCVRVAVLGKQERGRPARAAASAAAGASHPRFSSDERERRRRVAFDRGAVVRRLPARRDQMGRVMTSPMLDPVASHGTAASLNSLTSTPTVTSQMLAATLSGT